MAVKELYVGNLLDNVDLDEVTPLFAQYGVFHDARLVSAREAGCLHTIAFITMEERAADECIRWLDGEEFMGLTLFVAEATSDTEIDIRAI